MSHMRLDYFCDRYNVSIDNVYTHKSIGALPEAIFNKDGKSAMTIDSAFIVKRKEYRRKVNLYCQDVYLLLTEHFSIGHISEAMSKYMEINIGSMNMFMNNHLFMIDDTTILKYKIPDLAWKFYRYCRAIMRRLNYIFGFDVSVDKILDRRMI